MFSCVWLAVVGGGVGYCFASWLLASANSKMSLVRKKLSACVGAAAVPLDWGTMWQRWPVAPMVLAALAHCVALGVVTLGHRRGVRVVHPV